MLTKTKIKYFIIAAAVIVTAVSIYYFSTDCKNSVSVAKKSASIAKNNVILITSDGVLPVEQKLTDSLDFEFYDALATSPLSLPSGASLITGKSPRETTIRVNGVGSIPQEMPTIATYLTKKNYACGAFFSSLMFAQSHGLTNGFIAYDSSFAISNNIPQLVANADFVLPRAASFINRQNTKNNKDSFVWIHISEPIVGSSSPEATAQKLVEFVEKYNSPSTTIIYTPLANPVKQPFPAQTLEECKVRLGVNKQNLIPQETTVSLMNVPAIIFAILENKPLSLETLAQPNAETIMPWYIFNLPPKRIGWEGDWGLSEVKAQVLPSRFETFTIAMHGVDGEGLIPPYPSTNVLQSVTNEVAFFEEAAIAKTNSVEQLAAFVEKYPTVPMFHYWHAEALYNTGDYMEACNAYGRASNLGYNMLISISRQSLCHTKLSNIPAAIERAETAFLLNPTDFVLRKELSSLLYSTGVSMYKAKNYSTAKECLNRVLWLSPSQLDAYVQMSHIYLAEGNTNLAINVVNQALKLKPDYTPAKKLLENLE